jgi:large conductance mechanosensitive channel
MSFRSEFRAFISRGNVVDLAVGVIIGGAFGKIVSSLVGDVIMPPLGLLLARVRFENLFVTLSGPNTETIAEAKAANAVTVNYGLFLDNVVQFLILAVVIFFLVRSIERLRKKPEPTATTKKCPFCVTDIPLEARRCPNCTSELERGPAAA